MIVSLRSIRPFPASVDAGAQATANMAVTPNYSGSVNVTCDTSAMPGAHAYCLPANPVVISANAAANPDDPLKITLNVPDTAAPTPYKHQRYSGRSIGEAEPHPRVAAHRQAGLLSQLRYSQPDGSSRTNRAAPIN